MNKRKGSVPLPDSTDERLFRAVRSGDLRVVRKMINGGANVNVKNSLGLPLILFAQQSGIADDLLKAGAAIDARAPSGETVLHFAAQADIHLLNCFLNHHADPNTTNCEGETPLFYAEMVENLQSLNLLIDAGGRVNAQRRDGRTALHQAVFAGHEKCVRLLLERGANIECRDKEGRTPLIIAAFMDVWGVSTIEQLIDQHAEIGAADNLGWQAIHHAAAHGNSKLVRQLLSAGANPWECTADGLNAIDCAQVYGQLATADRLINGGGKGDRGAY